MSKHADVVTIDFWEVSTLVDIGEVSVIEVRALAVILIQKLNENAVRYGRMWLPNLI